MKKLLALVLSLMLLLPVFALAEDTATLVPVEFEDFTMYLSPDDSLQTADKADMQVMAYIYPHYDETASGAQNINIIWTSDGTIDLGGMDIVTYGQLQVDGFVQGITSQGITVSDYELGSTYQDDTSLTLYFTIDVDYSALNIDLKTTLHMCIAILSLGERGSYVFTLTADSAEDLDMLSDYVANIEWKE